MRVTVGIKAFKHEPYIAQAIQSALAQQTSFEFEILVAEDFSPDRTREIVQDLAARFPGKIRLFLPPQNIGRHRIVDAICTQARGALIALMDGDDFWTDVTKLQRQVEFLDAHPECSCCCHDAVVEYENGTAPHLYVQKPKREIYSLRDFLNAELPIPTSSTMFRRGVFGDFPPWFFQTGMADFPMHVLNARFGEIGFLDRPMMVYRCHAGGIWSEGATRLAPASAVKRYGLMLELYETLALYLGPLHRDVLDRNIANLCDDLVWSHLCLGNLAAVRRFLRRGASLRQMTPNVSKAFLWKAYAFAYLPGLYRLYRALRPGTFAP